MPSVTYSIRGLLATGLIVSALLCCCQGGSLGQVYTRLVETGSVFAQGEVLSCCASAKANTPSAPSDDGRPCDCRTRVKTKSMPHAKPAVEFAEVVVLAPVLVAWVGATAPALATPDAFAGEVFVRPPTSLLRQHCALVI